MVVLLRCTVRAACAVMALVGPSGCAGLPPVVMFMLLRCVLRCLCCPGAGGASHGAVLSARPAACLMNAHIAHTCMVQC